jgi:chromosome segregation ATPase
MSESKKPSQVEVQAYLKESLKTLAESPQKLSKHEFRLLTKFKGASEGINRAQKDFKDLGEQVIQAEARRRSIELQIENMQGAINMAVDELIALKYDTVEDEVPPKASEEVPS